MTYESFAPTTKTDEQDHRDLLVPAPTWPTSMERTFVMNKRKAELSNIPLPQSAASFYDRVSPLIEVVEVCESAKRVNAYLKARKDEINAGVPGRFLHAVIGQDIPGKFGN